MIIARWSRTGRMLQRIVRRKREQEYVDRKIRLRKHRAAALRRIGPAAGSLSPMAIDIVNNFNNSNTGTGQRAWPEISGYPPVFGNFIGEIAHTGGGTYIWTGFSWEPAIYPG